MTEREWERFSEELACGIAVMELALGRSIWRLRVCLLVGSMREIRFRVAVRSFNEAVWGESGVLVEVIWQKK